MIGFLIAATAALLLISAGNRRRLATQPVRVNRKR
jgi:hypothetical protein